MTGATRRSALGRGLMLLAGALGLGAGAKLAAEATAGPHELVLYGRLRTRGLAPAAGERLPVLGELAETQDGPSLGRLLGAAFALGDAERLELHTFELPTGTIVGTGTAGLAEGVFAVLGGTGAYESARGSYRVELDRPELGGDGSAVFRLTLTG